MNGKHTDHSLECIQDGQILQEAMISLRYTIQAVIEGPFNPESNLLYRIPPNEGRRNN